MSIRATSLLVTFLTSTSGFANMCTEQAYADYQNALAQCGSGGTDEWDCRVVVENSSGTIDSSRCPSDRGGPWACYEDVAETCEARSSGQEVVRRYQRFTGQCGQLSDCW
jgi:hypothetical protein